MNSHCRKVMTEAEFAEFMRAFPQKCVAAFGKGSSDRFDRPWGALKFNNKVAELSLPYRLVEDKASKTYRIEVNNATEYNKEA